MEDARVLRVKVRVWEVWVRASEGVRVKDDQGEGEGEGEGGGWRWCG